MSKVFIKRTRGLQNIQQVKAHAKYVGFRSKEADEKGFFGRNQDRVNYNDFINRIETNKALNHPLSIKAQKLVFSLREVDYKAYKRSGNDYKELVRKTLRDFEEKKGVKLDWIANIHEVKGHPHVHVIIKGVSDTKGDRGYTRIKIDKEDIKNMKMDFDREFEKDVDYRFHEKLDMDKTMSDISNGFNAVTQSIKREIEKEQQKAEMERERLSKNRDRNIER